MSIKKLDNKIKKEAYDKKLLLVIDVKNDFVDSNNIHILDKISELIYSNKYDDVVFTRFINDTESIWYKQLDYKGCITEEERRIAIDTGNNKIFDKAIYSAVNNELEEYIKNNIVALKELNNGIGNTMNTKDINEITNVAFEDKLDVIYELIHLMTEQVELFSEKYHQVSLNNISVIRL